MRTFTDADAPSLAAYRSDPAVARYQSWAIPFTLQQAEALIAEQAHLAGPAPGEWLQIAVEASSTVVGDVAVHLSEDGLSAEVGCTLAPVHQGKGYAREAMRALLDLLLDHVEVRRIEAEIDPRNTASVSLFEDLGFVHEGTDRHALQIRGEWCDSARYALVRDEAGSGAS